MTLDSTSPRSRRAILAGGLAAIGALVAQAVTRPGSALASDGQTIVVGGEYDSTSVTAVTNASGDGLLGASFGSGAGVRGESNTGRGVRAVSTSGDGLEASSSTGFGVRASSGSGYGLYGSSSSGVGVFGIGFNDTGVRGESQAASRAGVTGSSQANATGVLGYLGNQQPAAKPQTGVYGHVDQDANGRGVWGYSPFGQGVKGEATTGRGVQGSATSGIGVRASATSGLGLYASATTGHALISDGRVRFDKSAGLATIANATSSIVVTPGVDLTATSAVIATLNGNAGGSTAVKRVAVDTTLNKFTIYLTANTTAAVKVAWFVIG